MSDRCPLGYLFVRGNETESMVRRYLKLSPVASAAVSSRVVIRVKLLLEPRREKTCIRCFRRGLDTSQAAQPQKMARDLKF